MMICFTLIGPLPFIHFQPTRATVYTYAALVGIGFGCVVVSTFGRSYKATKAMGFKDNINTYLMMSGRAHEI